MTTSHFNCSIIVVNFILFLLACFFCLTCQQQPQSDECLIDIGRIRAGNFENHDEIFVATGKSLYDLGHFDRCQQISNAQYCLVYFGNESRPLVAQMGTKFKLN
jgi:hypothetical protein